MSSLIVVLIGVLGGLAGALQSQFLGTMEDKVGTVASTLITYGGGGLVIGVVAILTRGGRLSEIRNVPWWALSAGLLGVLIVATLGITVSNLGLGAGFTLFTGSTLIWAAIIDQLAWFGDGRPIDAGRAAGFALVIFGTWLVVRT